MGRLVVSKPAASVSPRLVTELDRTWQAIRGRHPHVPEVVIALGAGSAGRRGLKYGHFAVGRWERRGGQMPELFIGGEGLARGPVDVLGTLLHEAVHGIAAKRGIQDTSRQGRWHNASFRELAAEVGITVTKVPSLGWSETSVPDLTARTYRTELQGLAAAITAFRHTEIPGRANSNNGVSAQCACPRKIRVARSTLERGPITCRLCGKDFAERGSDHE
jgi:hypothetical protein